MQTLPSDPQHFRDSLSAAMGGTSPAVDPRVAIDFYSFTLEQTWAHMSRIVGNLGARAIVEHSARGAARRFPELSQIVVTEEGVNLAPLIVADNGLDSERVHHCLEQLCLAVFQVLADLTGDVILGPLLESLKSQPRGGKRDTT